MNGKLLKTIISLLTFVGIIFGAYFYIDNRYAKSEELKQTNKSVEEVKKRFEYKITQDALEAAEQRTYRIETAYDNKKMPDTVKEEYDGLKIKQDTLKRTLDKMETIK